MAILTGNVKSVRVVDGKYKTGKRQGDEWEFLALEIIDAGTGFLWSCQLASEDGSYPAVAKVDHHTLQVASCRKNLHPNIYA